MKILLCFVILMVGLFSLETSMKGLLDIKNEKPEMPVPSYGFTQISFSEEKLVKFEDLYPSEWPTPNYQIVSGLNDSIFYLGKLLFYDPVLSDNNSLSCASCHASFNAFSHTDHPLSHGIHDSIGRRNAPALFNIAWQKELMWDGAINHIEVQALAPITHPAEMGSNLKELIQKLQIHPAYPKLFYSAFGSDSITGERLLKALAHFQLRLISAYSKYDQVKSGFDSFSEKENKGYLVFQNNCATCHAEPLFSDFSFQKNGLHVDSVLKDYGRFEITGIYGDSLKFKVPSLRNLKYTYPYMHDGRFHSLREVIGHYRNQKLVHQGKFIQINITDSQAVDLMAFLQTLNDEKFVFDKKFSFPKELLQFHTKN